ncbi:MAG: AIR synthase-related protein, partial [Acidimicrobiales bacterium]
HLDDVLGVDHGGAVAPPDPNAADRHRQMHELIRTGLARSVHDVAEGGLAVGAAEWALGGRLGVELDVGGGSAEPLPPEVLFGEGAGRYLVEAAPEDREAVLAAAPGAIRIGAVVAEPTVSIGSGLTVGLDEIRLAFAGQRQTPASPTQQQERS